MFVKPDIETMSRGGHLRLKRSQNGTLYWGSMFYNKLPPSVRELPMKNFSSVLQDFLLWHGHTSVSMSIWMIIQFEFSIICIIYIMEIYIIYFHYYFYLFF
uniref:Uncharacterized protein n=1 Tax=Cacopsylla melanoneura TaxID=428564 RepID=A0A8D8SQR2_9HEMI